MDNINGLQLTMPVAGLAVVIFAIGLAIVDLILVLVRGDASTVSQFLISLGFKSPLPILCVGILIGHLFCYMYVPNGNPAQIPWHMFAEGALIGLIAGYIARFLLAKTL